MLSRGLAGGAKVRGAAHVQCQAVLLTNPAEFGAVLLAGAAVVAPGVGLVALVAGGRENGCVAAAEAEELETLEHMDHPLWWERAKLTKPTLRIYSRLFAGRAFHRG